MSDCRFGIGKAVGKLIDHMNSSVTESCGREVAPAEWC